MKKEMRACDCCGKLHPVLELLYCESGRKQYGIGLRQLSGGTYIYGRTKGILTVN